MAESTSAAVNEKESRSPHRGKKLLFVTKFSKTKKSGVRVAKKNLSMFLRQWHQRAGLFSFIFMGWLGVSGFLLNQSAPWGLDAIRVKSQLIMSMYGLYPQVPESGYISENHWLVNTTENTVMDGLKLDRHIPSPLGFAVTGKSDDLKMYVATKEKLTLVNGRGEVLEEISDYMLPVSAINQVGYLPGADGESQKIVVRGEASYSTEDGFTWTRLNDADELVKWSSLSPIDENIKKDVLPFASPTVALEQVIIDMHSGRLFGRFGPYVINAVGVACLWLSISGVWMMWRSNRRRRK